MSEDMKTRLLGLAFLVGAAVLALINLNELKTKGTFGVISTAFVPMGGLLGLGMLIHGEAAAPRDASVLIRAYGFVGSVLAAVLMYRQGFLADLTSPDPVSKALAYGVVAITLAVWFLPKRFIGN